MKPTVGRIVHYAIGDNDGEYPPKPLAAIVTKSTHHYRRECDHEEQTYEVWLQVFFTKITDFLEDVPYSEEYKQGHWTWPPRE